MVKIYKDICFVLFVIQTLVELSTTTYIFRGDIDQFSSDIAIKSDINKNCNSSGGYCKCATLETFIYHKDINKGECVNNYEYMSDCQSDWQFKRIEIVRSASKSPVTFTFKMSGRLSCRWEKTEYTEYGADYTAFPPSSNPGRILVQRVVLNNNLKTLKISNPNKLLSVYPGMLLKLRIQCNEFGISGVTTTTCLLLKIEGRRYFTINPDSPSVSRTLSTTSSTLSSIPSLTPSRTSSMTPSPTPLLLMSSSVSPTTPISDMAVTPQTAESLNTSPSTITTKLSKSLSSTTTIPPDPENGKSGGAENESSDLVLILAPTLLMFVLAVVLVGLLLICRRRSKSLSRNIEKGSDDDNNTLPHHATLTKKPQDASQAYAVPESQINTTPVYDNVHENAPNHYQFEYDYATCDAPAQTISDSTSPQSIYQEIDTLDGVSESNVNSEDNMYVDESKENPYYHSLEDETSKKNIYEEAQTNEPFYNVLEKPN